MNPEFSEWEPFGNIYMQNKDPPNRFSSRFNPKNWGATRLFDQSLSELANTVLDQEAVGLVVGLSDKPTPKQLMDDRIINIAEEQGHRFWSKKEAKSSFIYKELLDSFSAGSKLDIYVDSLRYPYGDALTFDDCFGSDFMELHCTDVVEVEGVDFRSNSVFEPEVVSAEEFEFRNDRLWCLAKAQLDKDQGDSALWTILDSKFKKDYKRMWSVIESKASEVGFLSSLDLSKQMDDRMLYKIILELFKRSPDRIKVDDYRKDGTAREESIEINENDCGTQPPVTISNSPLEEYWEKIFPVSYHEQSEEVEQIEEENWAETKTEFEDDDQEEKVVSNPVAEKSHTVEVVDDNSSTMSCCTKDTEDMAMVVCSKKTLDGIVNELDDYFLKASACGKKIAVLMNINKWDTYLPLNINENKRKRSNSAKVFSALSWSWSFKSLQSSHGDGATDFCGSSEPCKPGAHSITLEKLYAAEQKLCKEVKEEEMAKLEHERKSMLLQRQEDENHPKTEKTRSCVESLESDIRRLQYSISETCSSILTLINRELYPQLVTLISGLMHTWRTMYECHQVQNYISQRLNHLIDVQNMDSTTDNHLQATSQLETELTDCLVDDHQQSHNSSAIRKFCQDWQLVFYKLPEKVVSEAIKSFLSAIQAIFQQQMEELNLQKKSDRLERRLEKELNSLAEMERRLQRELNSVAVTTEERLEGSSSTVEVAQSNLSPKHPVSLKRSKIVALKERVEAEKAKYLNLVQITRAMTLNNLKTSLPNVFQALAEFSRASAHAFQAVYSHFEQATLSDEPENSTTN
ncbi:hypothetical protein EZV62_027364 [Acer yangbiense]|uniref:DUF632 domain-containing protein n=1 Tax=Acer yangbiense TaxID=1000413 RepID=A0A5C7GU22_9ROSI|nr:hypothetical protein EZV62_027364 [Acer yangbiense]